MTRHILFAFVATAALFGARAQSCKKMSATAIRTFEKRIELWEGWGRALKTAKLIRSANTAYGAPTQITPLLTHDSAAKIYNGMRAVVLALADMMAPLKPIELQGNKVRSYSDLYYVNYPMNFDLKSRDTTLIKAQIQLYEESRDMDDVITLYNNMLQKCGGEQKLLQKFITRLRKTSIRRFEEL